MSSLRCFLVWQVHLAYAEAGGSSAGAPAEAWPAMARLFEAFLLGAEAPPVRTLRHQHCSMATHMSFRMRSQQI